MARGPSKRVQFRWPSGAQAAVDPGGREAPGGVAASEGNVADRAAAAPASIEPAARRLAATAPWDAEADDALVCLAVRDETHDVKIFVLAPSEPRRFTYAPGQFLTLAFEIGAETIHRCYTISSAPTRPHAVSITVKRVPGGPVSNWLHDTLKPGDAVRALEPMGDFSCFTHPAPKYLLLSGGSGVTPMMAMARTFHDLGEHFGALPEAERQAVAKAGRALDAEAAQAPAVRTFRVEFARTRRMLDCLEDSTVLDAARRAGIQLPSSCAKGLCGTCKSKLVKGTVAMTHAGGIRQREIDAGLVLLCCSKPTSDLVVER